MTIRINKVKITKQNKISINYEVKNERIDTWDEYYLSCSDAPRPEFEKALRNLNTHVIDLCELPQAYIDRIKVNGVTFSYGGADEVMGAVIVSQMELKFSNCDLNLNTPHKASASYNSDYEADPEQLLTEDCIEVLEELCYEATRYIKGERAQTNLFAVL